MPAFQSGAFDAGAFDVAGVSAYVLDTTPGAYAITGATASLVATRALQSTAGSYAVTGAEAQLSYSAEVLAARLAGFQIDNTDSALWWKRKPRTVAIEDARAKVARVGVAIEQELEQARVLAAKATRLDVRQAIAPYLREMPGFDWRRLFQVLYAQEQARRQAQAALALAFEQDEDDVILLLTS